MFTSSCVSEQSEVRFRATIDLPFHASKKNSKQIWFNKKTGRRFISSNSRVKEAQAILLHELRSRARAAGISEPLKDRMHTVLLFGFPADQFYTRKLKESRTLGDCSNLAQIVEDALEKSGIVENDCLLAPLYVDRIVTKTLQVQIELRGK